MKPGSIRRPPTWLLDAALIALALADALLTYEGPLSPMLALPLLAVAGLPLRRRWPLLSLALVIPALHVGCAVIAMVAALYAVAARERRTWLIVVSGLVVFGVQVNVAAPFADFTALFSAAISAALFAGGPVALGFLARAWAELRVRYEELEESEGVRRTLAARQALARERSVLAREMHDVVSHNVSLIAVQAGALQVSAPDPGTRDAARAIRGLGVLTLEELRAMVGLLRTAGGATREVHPQPGISDLPALVAGTGDDVALDLLLPEDLPPAAQRTVYRTVQECLTNARKHSPGAAIEVRGRETAAGIRIEVLVGPATGEPQRIPGAGYGLLGLAERAQLQGGRFTSGETPAGWRSVLELPLEPASATAEPADARSGS